MARLGGPSWSARPEHRTLSPPPPPPPPPGAHWTLPLLAILLAEAFDRPSGVNHSEKLTIHTCLLPHHHHHHQEGCQMELAKREATEFRALDHGALTLSS